MSSILALIRVQWLTHTSYRLNLVFSVLGVFVMFVPLYLVAGALQPVVADSIAEEGAVYFGFLLTGMVALQVVTAVAMGLPNAVSGGIASGTLEALFATPVALPRLLIGLVGYGLLWACIRGTLLLVGFIALGGAVSVSALPLAGAIVLLLILAHLPLGLLAASMILVFRTAGPIVPAVMAAAGLLGGVYYSTTVIPDVVRPLAALVPLTYGLRAFRRTLLSGESWQAVAGDVAILAVFAAVLLAVSLAIFRWSLRYAQRNGSLAQY